MQGEMLRTGNIIFRPVVIRTRSIRYTPPSSRGSFINSSMDARCARAALTIIGFGSKKVEEGVGGERASEGDGAEGG